MKEMRVIILPVGDVVPYENNPRNNDQAVDAVANSIKEFGFKVPIIIDKNNVIVAGHTRLKAAKKLGLESVPCIMADDLTEDQIKAFRIADNKVGEIATWDFDKLNIELSGIELDMSQFGFDLEIEEEDFEVEEVEPVEPPENPTTKQGDIWILGDHRLICEDSTDINAIEKLLDGKLADLLLTDPPYNVALGMGGSVDEARKRHRRTDGLVIMNDKQDDEDFYEFLLSFYNAAFSNLKEGASYYIWHADNESLNFRKALKDAGITLRQTLIWNKNTFTLGRQDYQWKHEPCLYGWKDGASHNWYSDRSQSTVLDFNRPTKSDIHPTMKPVELFAYQIQCSSQIGDIVLDPFGGSGTTLIACEQLKRRCFTSELDPRYCDAIIQRWENFTGKKAVLMKEENDV